MPAGRLESRIKVHAQRITCLANADDTIWSSSFDGTVHVLDASSRHSVTQIPITGDVVACLLPAPATPQVLRKEEAN